MSDRELLELAAKAAGYEPEGMEQGLMYLLGVQDGWNPLTDDEDAFRLAVNLRILHEIYICGDDKVIYRDDFIIYFHECEDDPMAATRRAIVRAAAEIGRRA